MLAMYDASQGAYEAARRRYEMLRKKTETISIDYVHGRTGREQVRAVTAEYLAAEAELARAAERLRESRRWLIG